MSFNPVPAINTISRLLGLDRLPYQDFGSSTSRHWELEDGSRLHIWGVDASGDHLISIRRWSKGSTFQVEACQLRIGSPQKTLIYRFSKSAEILYTQGGKSALSMGVQYHLRGNEPWSDAIGVGRYDRLDAYRARRVSASCYEGMDLRESRREVVAAVLRRDGKRWVRFSGAGVSHRSDLFPTTGPISSVQVRLISTKGLLTRSNFDFAQALRRAFSLEAAYRTSGGQLRPVLTWSAEQFVRPGASLGVVAVSLLGAFLVFTLGSRPLIV